MKKSRPIKKNLATNKLLAPKRLSRNLRQKNLVVALLVLLLVCLFFFITYNRLKTGSNI